MDEWIDRFAEAIGEEPISPEEMGAMLKISREVAHRVERKLAPLSTFLAGLYVGRRMAEGSSRAEAGQRATEMALALLPPRPEEEESQQG